MCTRVQRLLLLLSGVVALAAARPSEADPVQLTPRAHSSPTGTSTTGAAATAVAPPTEAGVEPPRSKRQILFSTHGYPGLVYPGYYPGYFDLRYPSLTYPTYPAFSAYPGFGYPVLIG